MVLFVEQSGYQDGVEIANTISLSLPLPIITASLGPPPESLILKTWYPECQYSTAYLDHLPRASILLLHHVNVSFSLLMLDESPKSLLFEYYL